MPLTTKGNLLILHILKHIIQDGVSNLILVGEMREAHNQGPTYQNQGFSNPAPPFQNQGP